MPVAMQGIKKISGFICAGYFYMKIFCNSIIHFMTLEHAAIWTSNLECLKDYYIKYFDAIANNKYINHSKGFESYFLSFESGARLEIMTRPDIPPNKNDTVDQQYRGIIHLAFGVESIGEVDEKANQLFGDN